MSQLPALGTLAFFLGLLLTAVVRFLACRVGLVDRPDQIRKLHREGVPLGGGVAVLLAATLAVIVACIWIWPLSYHLKIQVDMLLALLAAATGICLVGLADDRWCLRGRQKLAGQVVIVVILVSSGLIIRNIRVMQWELELGLLAIPFTMLWFLGAINALNLIDGADGMATTIGVILSITLAMMAAIQGHYVEAAVAVCLGGALLGFLVFNFPPASIFLGDSGSMLVGLVLGVLAFRSALKGPATVALAAPLAILAVPIFDSFVAILRRGLTGRSIYATDRGHLHHCLLDRGLGNRWMLAVVALLCVGSAGGALVSVSLHNDLLAVLAVGAVIGSLVASRAFGFTELSLLASRFLALGGSLLPPAVGKTQRTRQRIVRLQGSRDWHQLWDTLTEFGERHELCRLRLNLNLSWLHEEFHASWDRSSPAGDSERWLTSMPLVAHGRTVGRLEIGGALTDESVYTLLSLVAELLESMEPCIHRLSAEEPVAVELEGAAAPAVVESDDSGVVETASAGRAEG